MMDEQQQLRVIKDNAQIIVFIRMHNGNGCLLEINQMDTFESLIGRLTKKQFQLPQTFRLIFKGKHIRNYKDTIRSYGIQNNSILHVEGVQKRSLRDERIDVCVFYLQEKFVVKISNREKVLNLKQKISQFTNISTRQMLLVFAGCKLKNQKELSHYKIKTDSLLCMYTENKTDKSQIQSDYQPVQILKCRQNQLIESVMSLNQKRSITSKTTLFRSQSIDKKFTFEMPIFEVQVQQEKSSSDNFQNNRDFNFDLFKGKGNVKNNMKESNLFDSVDEIVINNSTDFEIQRNEETNKLKSSGFNFSRCNMNQYFRNSLTDSQMI